MRLLNIDVSGKFEKLIDEQLVDFYTNSSNLDKNPEGILVNKKALKKWMKKAGAWYAYKKSKKTNDPQVFYYRGIKVYSSNDLKKEEIVVF